MNFIRGFFSVAFFSATLALGQSPNEPATGHEIVAELRSMQPQGNSEISGVLKIDSGNRIREIPVVCNIVTNGDSWKVIYQTHATTNGGAEKLVVIRSPNAPNQYFYARAATSNSPLPQATLLSSSDAAIPLAGSDFWLSELGFDFLLWPQQQKLKGEMRLGQACYVLESRNPDAPKVVRVKSFIDKDSGGLLIAEGYDRQNKLIKEFSLGNSSFKKVNGQWQLRRMKMVSPKIDSETILEFDLPKE